MSAKADAVRTMFTRIARRYDVMNSLMTGGRHHAWRRVAAREVVASPPGPVLDLATGTADLALAVRAADASRRVVGVDFSEAMLREGRDKLHARAERAVTLLAGDALRLPFADESFACVTSAFLLRNLEDLGAGVREMRRVTRRGGRLVALEITSPTLPGWAPVFDLYFHRVVPALGALVARDRHAYTYLPRSVRAFLPPGPLASLLAEIGYRDVRYQTVALGTIAIHVGVK